MAAQGKRGGNRERKMSLAAHLVELRKRLFRAALGVLVGAVVGFIFSPWVLEQISGPITEIASTRNATLNFASDLVVRLANANCDLCWVVFV